jgi:hypothetical protein
MYEALKAPDHPYADWLSAFVDVRLIHVLVPQWKLFWLRHATETGMPRQWLRWAFQHLQAYKRITDGTPGDEQLSAHLVEADLFLSADRGMVDIAKRAAKEARFRIAQSQSVVGGREGVEQLLALLHEHRYVGQP